MKKKAGKIILLTGMLCILSLAVCACGKTGDTSDAREPQAAPGESTPEDDTGDDVSTPEPTTGTEGTGTGNEAEKPGAQSTSGTSEEWVDSTPDLEGDIKDLKDGQVTVVEAITEKADDGSEIMVVPGSEDDSGFNKVTVTYDENTLFAIQTIYDGGARSEMSEATAADLSSGQLVQVWGSSSGGEWKATQICIVKVN